MAGDDDNSWLKSLTDFQQSVQRSGPAATASYTLIGSILLLGGIGYLLDDWLKTSPGFLVGGIILGLIVGFYGLARTIWK